MQRSKRKKGPFAERLYYELEEIDLICLEALKSVDCLPESPQAIRIDRFIEKKFQCDIQYEDFAPGVLGCTVFTPKGTVEAVLLSSALSDGSRHADRRLRSTLAHEGGHGLLHGPLFIRTGPIQQYFQFDGAIPPDRIMCRGDEIGVQSNRLYDGKWWEYQANRAIGGLLLPKSLVDDAMKAKFSDMVLTAAQRNSAARDLAEIFDVNPVVAKIRIAEMYPESVAA